MRLKNKKTREIGYLYEHSLTQDIIIVYDVRGIVGKYTSLAELERDWEDAPEEPKEYWFVNDLDGEPMKCELKNCSKSNFIEWSKHRKQIGNYFETKEEAEKACEKLKAWKRLKDKGFEITGWKIYPLPDEYIDGKRIWYNTVLRGHIRFEVPIEKSVDIEKELEYFVTNGDGGEE